MIYGSIQNQFFEPRSSWSGLSGQVSLQQCRRALSTASQQKLDIPRHTTNSSPARHLDSSQRDWNGVWPLLDPGFPFSAVCSELGMLAPTQNAYTSTPILALQHNRVEILCLASHKPPRPRCTDVHQHVESGLDSTPKPKPRIP